MSKINHLIIGIIFSLLVFFSFALNAEAASFNHVHTDSCYQSVTKQCTNHHIKTSLYYETKHCFTCQYQLDHLVSCYDDVCDSGLIADRNVGYKVQCTKCGAYRLNSYTTEPTGHAYTTSEIACGMTADSTAATISLSAASDAPTNGSVTLTAGVDICDSTFSLAEAAYDFGNGYTSSNSTEVTENGTYLVTVLSADGRTAQTSVTVSNIDKTAPCILAITKSTEDYSESGLSISVSASDEGSGLAATPFSFNGGEYTADNTYFVSSNQTVSVAVRDAADNVTTSSITITTVCRDPAVVAAEKAAEEARLRAEAEARALEAKAAREKAAAEKAEAEARALEAKAAKEKAAAEKAEAEAKALEAKEALEKVTIEKADAEGNSASTIKAKSNLLGLIKVSEVSENDVSENEVSINDTSENNVSGGNESSGDDDFGKIKVTDTRENAEADANAAGFEDASFAEGDTIESFDELLADDEKEADAYYGLPLVKASVSTYGLIAGAVMAALGGLFMLLFSYVYVQEDGRKKLVALAKIKATNEGLKVSVPGEKMTNHGRYLIYLSPVRKLFYKNRQVYVEVKGKADYIKTDEGRAFIY